MHFVRGCVVTHVFLRRRFQWRMYEKGEKNLFRSRQPLEVCRILRRSELEYYSSYRPNAEDPIKNGHSVLEIPYTSKISLGLNKVHYRKHSLMQSSCIYIMLPDPLDLVS